MTFLTSSSEDAIESGEMVTFEITRQWCSESKCLINRMMEKGSARTLKDRGLICKRERQYGNQEIPCVLPTTKCRQWRGKVGWKVKRGSIHFIQIMWGSKNQLTPQAVIGMVSLGTRQQMNSHLQARRWQSVRHWEHWPPCQRPPDKN